MKKIKHRADSETLARLCCLICGNGLTRAGLDTDSFDPKVYIVYESLKKYFDREKRQPGLVDKKRIWLFFQQQRLAKYWLLGLDEHDLWLKYTGNGSIEYCVFGMRVWKPITELLEIKLKCSNKKMK